jgi:hypothetical protein
MAYSPTCECALYASFHLRPTRCNKISNEISAVRPPISFTSQHLRPPTICLLRHSGRAILISHQRYWGWRRPVCDGGIPGRGRYLLAFSCLPTSTLAALLASFLAQQAEGPERLGRLSRRIGRHHPALNRGPPGDPESEVLRERHLGRRRHRQSGSCGLSFCVTFGPGARPAFVRRLRMNDSDKTPRKSSEKRNHSVAMTSFPAPLLRARGVQTHLFGRAPWWSHDPPWHKPCFSSE